MNNSFEKLQQLFMGFPGIGERQAGRFVYFLLTKDEKYLKEIADAILNIKEEVGQCKDCFRHFNHNQQTNKATCNICSNPNIDKSKLMVVAKEVDLKTIHNTNTYTGRYFVIGGLIPILGKNPEEKIRITKLKEFINNNSDDIEEIILALSANPEGEYTAEYLKNNLGQINNQIKISMLGKGLSTGTELEYSDYETIKNALINRK